MISLFLLVGTAVLSSLLTWLIAWAFFRFHLSEQVDRMKDDIGRELEDRVRRGVVAGGEELLPEFREQVKQGFLDALRSGPVSSAMGEAARNVARTGAELFGSGFDNLLKPRPRWRRN
ncbi:MAG: hypothetical protein ABF296_11275 [Oceanococcaceae bacterium]